MASRNGTLAGGVVLLFAYSLGPRLAVRARRPRLRPLHRRRVARTRHWLWAVELVAGVLLVGFGVLLLTDNIGWISNHVSSWLNDIGLGRLTTS